MLGCWSSSHKENLLLDVGVPVKFDYYVAGGKRHSAFNPFTPFRLKILPFSDDWRFSAVWKQSHLGRKIWIQCIKMERVQNYHLIEQCWKIGPKYSATSQHRQVSSALAFCFLFLLLCMVGKYWMVLKKQKLQWEYHSLVMLRKRYFSTENDWLQKQKRGQLEHITLLQHLHIVWDPESTLSWVHKVRQLNRL